MSLKKAFKDIFVAVWNLEALADFRKVWIKFMFNPTPISLLYITIVINNLTSWILEKVKEVYE